ncbi:bacteriocin immunity protein [Lactococcus formosensis]|uniref:bacteriocin immunity protein n=1 Tax=Lactococcus formosensis TaxID=1281486 RepID=UPI0007CB9B57|nr:bacteriocin immunity protein [Lactococcus formosensis]BAV02226.1 Enterocin A Immunity [Lactococcus formosensis]BDW48839.1 bacteriocin immunity protein [Lactococcus formosensis]BDX24423.1 bacteriocin immunity protein [Lactococcus formosensis]
MNKSLNQVEILNEMYNLILSKHIREWERTLILEAKNRIESQENLEDTLVQLESQLRPLALRYNLTPMTSEFYNKISNSNLFGRGVGHRV